MAEKSSMSYSQFKDLDVGGKLNVLFSIVTNHLAAHARREKALLGVVISLSLSITVLLVRTLLK